MDSTERLKPRSNFMRIERELYVFLRTIYGCGPKSQSPTETVAAAPAARERRHNDSFAERRRYAR
ncbi:hypothetical protein KIN20_034778 [Parelaphostrongylus tenuis]|uniref:Uncharacterized protein n=1 Tax=Parelaphostrongylus tenuis TaxID=148309 RepID=A0AAD5RA66_PARTN|nr:hypothetical protein KIN20_034778 [Parelaphostrongylus tenuis]